VWQLKTTKFKCAACGRKFERSIRIECEVGIFQGCPHCGCWDFAKQEYDIFSKEELMQFRALLRETEKMNQKLCELRVDGKAEDTELYELYENNRLRCMGLRMRIETFIFNIEDSQLRQIFSLRYIDGHSWQAVARRMGGITADCARMMHDRYLKKLNEE